MTDCVWAEQVQKASEDGLVGDMYMHTDIMEGPKEKGSAAHLQLGKPLTIRLVGKPNSKGDPPQEQYEDLDEVIVRYAEPLVGNINRVLGHRCALAHITNVHQTISTSRCLCR